MRYNITFKYIRNFIKNMHRFVKDKDKIGYERAYQLRLEKRLNTGDYLLNTCLPAKQSFKDS